MRLVTFTATNYRSITKAYKLDVDAFTVLLGPNNEGKSNILRALNLGLGALIDAPELLSLGKVSPEGTFTVRSVRRGYSWKDDFPIGLQATKPNGATQLVFQFTLSSSEIETFQSQVKSALNGNLTIQLDLGPSELQLKVLKKGPGSKSLTKKVASIAKFVSDHLDYEYIPAVRTAEAAEDIVTQMVRRALAPLEESQEYLDASKKLSDLQKPLLDNLSQTVCETLKAFLPNVKSVNVAINERERSYALRRSSQIFVDDGVSTLLKQKGDGVQSLASLGPIRKLSEGSAGSRQLVLTVEEPESHLHPRAIHELRKVLVELSLKHQIILTTHCPLLVNRARIGANILVSGGKAEPAKSMESIRTTLGVRASDNLQHANLVLIVEGEEDRMALLSILAASSTALKDGLATGAFAIDSLGGSSNLKYKLGLLRDAMCNCHAWLDHDSAGKAAEKAAVDDGLITPTDCHFATVLGKDESELEDLYADALCDKYLSANFGVISTHPKFSGKKKWSDRFLLVCGASGKAMDDAKLKKVKWDLAEAAAKSPTTAIETGRRGPLDALVKALEIRLAEATK